MKIVSLNIRGFKRDGKKEWVKKICRVEKPLGWIVGWIVGWKNFEVVRILALLKKKPMVGQGNIINLGRRAFHDNRRGGW